MINYIKTKIEAVYSYRNVVQNNILIYNLVKYDTDYSKIVLLCQKKHLIHTQNYSSL